MNGLLFALSLTDSRCRVIFIMATTNFENIRNFSISVPFESVQSFVRGPGFHLKVATCRHLL
jgi:hypothetical protein